MPDLYSTNNNTNTSQQRHCDIIKQIQLHPGVYVGPLEDQHSSGRGYPVKTRFHTYIRTVAILLTFFGVFKVLARGTGGVVKPDCKNKHVSSIVMPQ